MSKGHTGVRPGWRVVVKLLDGTAFEDVVVESPKNHRWMVFRDHGRVALKLISGVSKLKGVFNPRRCGDRSQDNQTDV